MFKSSCLHGTLMIHRSNDVQLCLPLTVFKLMVDPHYGQYLWVTGELC